MDDEDKKRLAEANQMEANIETYAASFDLCLKAATTLVEQHKPESKKDLDLDRQEIAEAMFQRFWDDQQEELRRKAQSKLGAPLQLALSDAFSQLQRGRII